VPKQTTPLWLIAAWWQKIRLTKVLRIDLDKAVALKTLKLKVKQ
jgi:hypothetical protein